MAAISYPKPQEKSSPLDTLLDWGSPGEKALLSMVVGEWWLPAAGQGGVCAGTLGFLLDPGGGAMESYCGVGQSKTSVT